MDIDTGLSCPLCGVVESWQVVNQQTGRVLAVVSDDDGVSWSANVYDASDVNIAGRNQNGMTDRVEAQETGRIGGMLRTLMTSPERRREIARLGGKAKAAKKLLS